MRHTQREPLIGFVTLWPVAKADFPACCRGCHFKDGLWFLKSLGVLCIDSVWWRSKSPACQNLYLQVIFILFFLVFRSFKQCNKQPSGNSCSCFAGGHHKFAGNSASCTRHFPARRDFDKSARATEYSAFICIQTAVSPWFVNMSSRCSVSRVLQVYKASLIQRHERRWQWWREKVRHDTVLRSRNTTSPLTFLAKTQPLNINYRGKIQLLDHGGQGIPDGMLDKLAWSKQEKKSWTF